MPAIDGDDGACDEARLIAGEQEERSINFRERADARHGDALDHVGAARRIEITFVHFRLEISRRDGIDADAVPGPFERQGFCLSARRNHYVTTGRDPRWSIRSNRVIARSEQIAGSSRAMMPE